MRRAEMGRGVAIWRVVAAADVAALQANSKMNPAASHLQAFLAPDRRPMRVPRRGDGHVSAGIRQIDRVIRFHRRSMVLEGPEVEVSGPRPTAYSRELD